MRDAALPTLPTTDAASEVRPTLIIFGRLPIAGHCKTRLIPALGPEGAARLYARMLSHIVDHACAARLGPPQPPGHQEAIGRRAVRDRAAVVR